MNTPKPDKPDNPFQQRLRDALEQQHQTLDPASAARLQHSRRPAQQAAQRAAQATTLGNSQTLRALPTQIANRLWQHLPKRPALASLASLALIAVIATLQHPANNPTAIDNQDDLSLLGADESLEFYNDLDLLLDAPIDNNHS